MKTLLLTLPVIALLIFGCSTAQRRTAYNSLATVGLTTDAAMKSYLDLVIQGQISTNSVPVVARDYQIFQGAFNLAVITAQFNTNAIASAEIIRLSNVVLSDISVAKGGAK